MLCKSPEAAVRVPIFKKERPKEAVSRPAQDADREIVYPARLPDGSLPNAVKTIPQMTGSRLF